VAGGGVVLTCPRPTPGQHNTPAEEKSPMKITLLAMAGLVAGTLMTASPAHADVPRPQQPSFSLSPQSDAEELRRQINDLDAAWDSLSPAERNQRIAGLQQQVTQVDLETRNGPRDQLAQVDAILLPSLIHLASLVRKSQGPNQPCYFPACLPGL
jgi:hypothetical protein